MTKKGIILLSIFLLVLAIGYFFFKYFLSNQLSSGWKKINDDKYGISFQYPESWVLDEIEGFSFPLFLKANAADEFYTMQIHLVENSSVDKELEIDATIGTAEDGTLKEDNIVINGKNTLQVTGNFKKGMPVSGSFVNTLIQYDSNVVKVLLNDSTYLDTYTKILNTFTFTN